MCLWGVTGLKRLIGADDALNVFGVHAVGGVFGALMTGISNAPLLGGPGAADWVSGAQAYPGIPRQFLIQLAAVCIVILWSGTVALAGFLLVKHTMGLRVAEDEEREGLDISSRGERAYDL